jgi:hypothetical protein
VVVPVLAVQAIEAAAPIEDSKVYVSDFSHRGVGIFWISCPCTSWTEPFCNTVGGERVIVPVKDPFLRRTTQPHEFAIEVRDETTETL